jgi:hypothetical protein
MTLGLFTLILAAVALLVEFIMKRVPYAAIALTILTIALLHLIR